MQTDPQFYHERNQRVRFLEGMVRNCLAEGDVEGASRYADRILCVMGWPIVAQVPV